MTKLSCFLLVAVATLTQRLFADDETLRILQSWNENYGAFAESEQYHYRCAFTRRCKTPDPSLDRRQLDPTLELGLEIFRLSQACRMDVIPGGDFSSFEASGWTHVFDGRAAITSQPYQGSGSRYFQIFPATRGLEAVRDHGEPYADPLADVLGFSVNASTTSWALGVPPDVKPFDLAAALAKGQFHVDSQDAEWIELRNTQGDQLTLSVRHNYALARRTWSWTLDTKLNCLLHNHQWKQFGDGTWYPELSQVVCSRSQGGNRQEDLFVADYRFSALPPSKRSDFDVTVDRDGTDLEYRGPGDDFRWRTLKAGETINVTQLAHDELSIRWDDRQAPYSVLEKWSIVPLTVIAAFLAIRLASVGQSRPGFLPPQRAILLALSLGVIFLLLIHLAMLLYEGGTKVEKALTSYSWTYNYLSDLGREYRYDEGDNHAVNVIFMLALCIAGGAMILYAWPLPDLFRRPVSKRLATLAAVCGLTVGWCYIRIGLAPVDSYRAEHHFYETVGGLTLGIMGLLHAAALLLEWDYPRRYGWSLLAFCLLLGAFVLLQQIDGPHWRSASSLAWRATAQKIVVYSQMLCLTVQATGSLRWLKRQQTNDSSSRDALRVRY